MLELRKIDPNYVYSLNSFVSIFVHAVAVAPKFEAAARFGGGSKKGSKKKGGGLAAVAKLMGAGNAGKKSLLGRQVAPTVMHSKNHARPPTHSTNLHCIALHCIATARKRACKVVAGHIYGWDYDSFW